MSSMTWERFSYSDKPEDSTSDLLVFGYSSKLFKDDEKARYIEEGKHLIPWMGDKCLLIDRFDVRGYLQDVTIYESKTLSKDNWMSSQEKEIEELCEEERFKDLDQDIELHEEEMKRLKASLSDGAYHEIGFNYETNETECDQLNKKAKGNSDAPGANETFKVPEGLSVPEGMQVPSTTKLHNVIEKTAAFISEHGTQMEILIKTKQSTNPQFDFLSFDSPLNPYYKHLVSLIKSGKYNPHTEKENDSDDSDGDHYLHPSLLGASKTPKSPPKPLILPKLPISDDDNAYSQLVKSLKSKVIPKPEDEMVKQKEASARDIKPTIINNDFSQSSQSNQIMSVKGSILPVPPPDVILIIDKLAFYVAKNGEEFEQTVKKRGEERFEFLNPGSMYHAHYIRKKIQLLEEKRKAQTEVIIKSSSTEKNSIEEKSGKCTNKINLKHQVSFPLGSKKDIKQSEKSEKEQVSTEISQEKLLQEKRRKKAAIFLSMLKAREKSTESCSIPSSSDNSEKTTLTLSPTIEAVTSPSSSPTKSDMSSRLEIRSSSLLPFVSVDKPSDRSEKKSDRKHRYHSNSHHRSKSRSRSRSRSKSPRRRKHKRRSRSRSRERRKRSRS